MNTRSAHAVYLKKGHKYIFCNEDLELAFEKDVLEEITEMWNARIKIDDIAIKFRRDPDEVFLAIFHQARAGKIKRKLNYIESVQHLKIKKDIPTVISYEGRRYIYEPQGR